MSDSTQQPPNDLGKRRPRKPSVKLDSDLNLCASYKPDGSQSSNEANDNDIRDGNLPRPDWCEDPRVKRDVLHTGGDSDSDSEESYQRYGRSGMTDDVSAGFQHWVKGDVSSAGRHSIPQRNCSHSPQRDHRHCPHGPQRNNQPQRDHQNSPQRNHQHSPQRNSQHFPQRDHQSSPQRNRRRRRMISLSSNSSHESTSSVIHYMYAVDQEPPKKTGSPGEFRAPILGYETIEARSKHTIFRIQVMDTRPETVYSRWFVFKRYSEFVELNDKLKKQFPSLQFSLPPKRWFRDNFDADFLDRRRLGLQLFMDNITGLTDVCNSEAVRDFFSTDNPPLPHKDLAESRALCDVLERSVCSLREQLEDKKLEIIRLRNGIKGAEAKIEAMQKACPLHSSMLL